MQCLSLIKSWKLRTFSLNKRPEFFHGVSTLNLFGGGWQKMLRSLAILRAKCLPWKIMSADGHSVNHSYRYTSLLRLQGVRFGNTVSVTWHKVSREAEVLKTLFLGCWVQCWWYLKMSENASVRCREREKPQGLPFNCIRGSRWVEILAGGTMAVGLQGKSLEWFSSVF